MRNGDSARAVAAADDAERVAGWVGEVPRAGFAFTGDTGGIWGEPFLHGPLGIADADVRVHLERIGGIGPLRPNPGGCALKASERSPGRHR
jgi:hypothetical protein